MTASPFNAWLDPWLPVATSRGDATVSLRDLYLRAHELTGLGAGLTPLDLDSLWRFLPAVGAVIARHNPDRYVHDQRFTVDSVDTFQAEHLARFNLAGDRPFLQRWDRTHADIDALAPGGDPATKVSPMQSLMPHEPGGSSIQWMVRRDSRDMTSWPAVTLQLVTAWFQTKNGNGKDPWGGGHQKGSAGTWHVNPMALFAIDPHNLGRTIAANMPADWLYSDDLPMFLDHHGMPDDFGSDPGSVYRFTYARTIPLLHVADGRPAGFILGSTGYPVPEMIGATSEKEALGMVHTDDHTRLYSLEHPKPKKGEPPQPPTRKPCGSFGERATSAEGFVHWFGAKRGIVGESGAFAAWRAADRALPLPSGLRGWDVGIYSETTDGKGNRRWCDWSILPARAAGADIGMVNLMAVLGAAVTGAKSRMLGPLRDAAGNTNAKEVPPQTDQAVAAFYTAAENILAAVRNDYTNDRPVDVAAHVAALAAAELAAFRAVTEPMITPATLPAVAAARSKHRRIVNGAAAHLVAAAGSNEENQ